MLNLSTYNNYLYWCAGFRDDGGYVDLLVADDAQLSDEARKDWSYHDLFLENAGPVDLLGEYDWMAVEEIILPRDGGGGSVLRGDYYAAKVVHVVKLVHVESDGKMAGFHDDGAARQETIEGMMDVDLDDCSM